MSNLYNKVVILPDFTQESKLWGKGIKYVIGADEVGRGAFAGPVTVAAVVFKCSNSYLSSIGINDSKLINSKEREKLSEIIKKDCHSFSIATVTLHQINKKGIGKATEMAFRRAIKNVMKQLGGNNFYLLVDGFNIKNVKGIGLRNQKAIIKGDRISISIAAASIIAKVHRDSLLIDLAKNYPQYELEKNKGYGTLRHRNAIKKFGLSKLHRKSFKLDKFT